MRNRTLQLARRLSFDRRQFVLSGASLAVLPWLGTLARGAAPRLSAFSANPFQLGVASGDPAPDGFVLWTRLAPAPLDGGGMPPEPVAVSWELFDDDTLRRGVKQGVTMAVPDLAHSVHVEVTGLDPDRWYWYRFSVGDAESPVGRARTTPAADASPTRLRFAFTSCQHYEQGLYTGFQHMASEELDLIVHLGDYIYEYGAEANRVRRHIGPEVNTLEQYRNRYAQYRTDPNLQRAHERCPWLIVWDDHEFDNNCAGDISEDPTVAPGDFLVRRANAYQAFYEHMPLRATSLPQGPHMQLYRQVAFGRLVNFAMLDTRQYRTDQPGGDGNRPLTGSVFSPQAAMLGDVQERWLTKELSRSETQWNVLGQQIMMARVDRLPGPLALYSMDSWSGYDVPRRRILSFLEERRIANPIVLSGDIHSNWVNDLKVNFALPHSPTVATEFVCTSLSSGGNGVQTPNGTDLMLADNPFVRFHNAERGYVSCTVTPREWRSDYQVVEYVDRPGAPLITRRSFVVENGQPGAKNA